MVACGLLGVCGVGQPKFLGGCVSGVVGEVRNRLAGEESSDSGNRVEQLNCEQISRKVSR